MSTTKLADNYSDIAQRLKEIEADKTRALNDSKLPEIGEAAVGFPYVSSADVDYVCWGTGDINEYMADPAIYWYGKEYK